MSNFEKTSDKSVIAWKENGSIWRQLEKMILVEKRFSMAFIEDKKELFRFAIEHKSKTARDIIIASTYVSEDSFIYKLHIDKDGNLWRFYTGEN